MCGTRGGARAPIPLPASPGVSSAEWEPPLVSPPWSWRGEILPPAAKQWLVLNEDVKPHTQSTLSIDSPVPAQTPAGRSRAVNPPDIPFEYHHISALLSCWAIVYGLRAERKSCAEPAECCFASGMLVLTTATQCQILPRAPCKSSHGQAWK